VNVSTVAAISKDLGLIHFESIPGPFNGEKFEHFFSQLYSKLTTQHPNTQFAFVLDNGPIHVQHKLNAIVTTTT
jgi:hypothetical protein